MSKLVSEYKSIDNHFKQKPIKELAGYTFIVEDYQRGYKWNFNQVLDLLNDINNFNPNGNLDSYCLQPVAVKAIDDSNISNNYELVDGQQRLTTIYIILKICGVKDLFKISYKTRLESEKFLDRINPFLNYEFDLWKDQSEKHIENTLNDRWSDYINDTKIAIENNVNYDNVDNYHFFQAALVIRSYFENPNNDKVKFLKKLINKVKVIWYQDPTNQTANKLFKNLNSGKIRLSASDLIKALFILDLEQENQLPAQIEFEQNKLASEWDDIEQNLHEPKFWSFIIGNTSRNYEDSRIGYLFEVLTNTIENKNIYECYRSYSNKDTKLNWDAVTDLFFTLKEWFNNVKVYHRIGFLMRQNIKDWRTLRDIHLEYQRAADKDNFELILEKQLVHLFNTTKRVDKEDVLIYSLDTISYHNLAEVRNLLVLFNIITYERVMSDYRLDFDQFYSGKWSVEHIQPQNPKDLDFDNVEIYINELSSFLKNFSNDEDATAYDILKDLEALLNAKDEADTDKKKRDYINKFTIIIKDQITDRFDLHGIGNLALLQSKDNSSIGNNSFKDKREQILNIFNAVESDKKSFIPISTLQVFTKFHSKEQVQLDFWNNQDAINYKSSIAEVMKSYLPNKKIVSNV
jgi:uncharacterized protein with ParB-like and HNH nuclease domain